MKALSVLASAIMLSTTASSAALPQNEAAIEITELPRPANTTVIPWVEMGNTAWQNTAPVFEVSDAQSGLSARGWLATTDAELLCRIDVRDNVHLNNKSGGNLWDGDFLRLSLDGHGNGSGTAPRDTGGPTGNDDASIGFALTSTGAQGWTFSSGDEDFRGEYPKHLLEFSRDETTQTTRYIVRLPWQLLHSAPGLFPTLGLAVQVRNVDSATQKEPVHVQWGEGANEQRAGLYQKVTVASPPRNYVASAISRHEIWNPGDAAEIVYALASTQNHTIRAAAGSRKAQLTVQGDAPRNWQRFSVRFKPPAGVSTATVLTSEVIGTSVKTPLAPQKVSVVLPHQVPAALYARLDELTATSPHPLFTRHLQSVRSLVQEEWTRLTIYGNQNPAKRRETLALTQKLLDGFQSDAAQWQSYLGGKRALFMAYVSPLDDKLSYYSLMLPAQWNPQQGRDEQAAFPMFVELHGAGNPHLLSWPAAQLGADQKAADLRGYEAPKTYAMIERSGYHVFPSGRGNLGYRGIGETDVWDALRDVEKNFKIDEDRRYLYGFSMGGGGTWRLGARTPDRWAALAIFAPSARAIGEERKIGLGRNVAHLPIWIWAGEEDFLWQSTLNVRDEIMAHGNRPQFSSTPKLGHSYIGEKQKEAHEWLKQFTRKRPDKFSFVADTEDHLGAWGITMTRDLSVGATPQFTCTIEGQTVRIDSSGTPALRVNLGASGLRLQGNVTLMWNGIKAYEGPVTVEPIRLTQPTPKP